MTSEMTATYQTRLVLDKEQEAILQCCACLLSTVERSLYAEVTKGKNSASCKNSFLKRFGITARQFNACRINLEGKLSAYQANQEKAIASLKQQIELLEKDIRLLEKKPSKPVILHQKKRRRNSLLSRLSFLEKDKKQKKIQIMLWRKKAISCSVSY